MLFDLLQGALLLTEVVKERDAQLEVKKAKQNWEKEREEYLYQMEQRVIVVLAYLPLSIIKFIHCQYVHLQILQIALLHSQSANFSASFTAPWVSFGGCACKNCLVPPCSDEYEWIVQLCAIYVPDNNLNFCSF